MKGGAAAAADLVIYVKMCADKTMNNSGLDDAVETLTHIDIDGSKEAEAEVKLEEKNIKDIVESLPEDVGVKDRIKLTHKIEAILSGKIRDVLPAIDTLISAVERAHTEELEKLKKYIENAKTAYYAKQLRTYRDSVISEYRTTKPWMKQTRATIEYAVRGKDPDEYIKTVVGVDPVIAGVELRILRLLNILTAIFMSSFVIFIAFNSIFGASILLTLSLVSVNISVLLIVLGLRLREHRYIWHSKISRT